MCSGSEADSYLIKAHRLLYHPTLGWRVMKKRERTSDELSGCDQQPQRAGVRSHVTVTAPIQSGVRGVGFGVTTFFKDFELKAKAIIWP